FPSWATFTDNGDGRATISGTPTAAGPSTFTITAHNGYGSDATQPFTLKVKQAASTTSFAAAPTPTYLGGNFTVHATNDSTATITYSQVSGPCALVSASLGTFSSSGAGSCVVKADSAATTNYLASSAQQT